MKSRDEIVIIMLQWLRLYTLGSRGSRELKTFLETRLISSRVDQKLITKKGSTSVLKRKLARRSWPIEAIVGAEFMRRGSDSLGMGHGFNSATNQLEFGFNFASMFATIFATIFTTIAPRSGRDRASIVVLLVRRSPSFQPATIPRQKSPRSRLDRTAIAVRSGRDRGVLLRTAYAVGFESVALAIWPSDRNQTIPRSSRKEADRASLGRRIGEVR